MITDSVAGLAYRPGYRGQPFDIGADLEKGGSDAMPIQNVEQAGSVFAGAVIERERQAAPRAIAMPH
jgi:hypothetical protein